MKGKFLNKSYKMVKLKFCFHVMPIARNRVGKLN